MSTAHLDACQRLRSCPCQGLTLCCLSCELQEFMSTRLGIRREGSVLSAVSRKEEDGLTYYDIAVRITSYASPRPFVASRKEVGTFYLICTAGLNEICIFTLLLGAHSCIGLCQISMQPDMQYTNHRAKVIYSFISRPSWLLAYVRAVCLTTFRCLSSVSVWKSCS